MHYTRLVDAFLAQDILDNRKVSLSAKLEATLELMSLGIEIKRESLSRQYPDLPREAIKQKLLEWLVYYD